MKVMTALTLDWNALISRHFTCWTWGFKGKLTYSTWLSVLNVPLPCGYCLPTINFDFHLLFLILYYIALELKPNFKIIYKYSQIFLVFIFVVILVIIFFFIIFFLFLLRWLQDLLLFNSLDIFLFREWLHPRKLSIFSNPVDNILCGSIALKYDRFFNDILSPKCDCRILHGLKILQLIPISINFTK